MQIYSDGAKNNNNFENVVFETPSHPPFLSIFHNFYDKTLYMILYRNTVKCVRWFSILFIFYQNTSRMYNLFDHDIDIM